MGHGGCWRGAVPMFFAGREPNNVARTNFFDGATFALRPADARSDDDGLTERMGVPRGAGARLECDHGGGGTRGGVWLEKRIDAHCAGEPIGWAFCGGL